MYSVYSSIERRLVRNRTLLCTCATAILLLLNEVLMSHW